MKDEDLPFIMSIVKKNIKLWKSQNIIAICTNCHCPTMPIRPCVFRHTDLQNIISERNGRCPFRPNTLEIVLLVEFGKHNSKW